MELVKVLLSTYNGEKYLEEQIDSLLNQTDIRTKICIRDDGSTDSTREILETYKNDDRIEIIYGLNIGYQASFMKLVEMCNESADYFSFCDQDDIWNPDKLLNAIKKMTESDYTGPKLYFSDLTVVNDNLEPIGYKNFIDRNITLGSAMSRSNIAGCTMVLNKKLVDIILECKEINKVSLGHDSWIYKICLSVDGEVIYDPHSYILFRRHNSTSSNLSKSMFKKIYYEFGRTTKYKNSTSKSAEIILKYYSRRMDKNNKKLLNSVISYRFSTLGTIKLCFNKKLKTGNIIIDCISLLKILTRTF